MLNSRSKKQRQKRLVQSTARLQSYKHVLYANVRIAVIIGAVGKLHVSKSRN